MFSVNAAKWWDNCQWHDNCTEFHFIMMHSAGSVVAENQSSFQHSSELLMKVYIL